MYGCEYGEGKGEGVTVRVGWSGLVSKLVWYWIAMHSPGYDKIGQDRIG